MSIEIDSMLDQLFLSARTHTAWTDRPVDDALLRRLYDVTRMAPTSANTQPARFAFVKSAEAKSRLLPALSQGNVDKTMRAPATAIVAYDPEFYENIPKLFPSRPEMKNSFSNMPELKRDFFLVQNSSLQAAYLILAARSLGLDCGPMGGFDRGKVDEAFFATTHWKSILLINLGYGDLAKLHPRNPRLEFDEACRIE